MSEPIFFRGKDNFALIADSHHNTLMLDRAVGALQGVGGVLLLGDCAPDADYLRKKMRIPDIYAVRGNCDFPGCAPEEISGLLFRTNGPRFFACHGHRYGVKMNTFSLLYKAKEIGATAVFYGHTHIAMMDREEGVLLANPGALQDGRYALVQIDKGALKIEYKRL